MGNSARCIRLDAEMILSKAFNELTGNGKQVLLLFLLRRPMERPDGIKGRWVPKEGAEIRFTYKEAEKAFGISRATFYRTLGDLIKKGFIELIHQGGSLDGDASSYTMSERWKDYGTDRFVVKDRPQGMGIGFVKRSKANASGNGQPKNLRVVN